MDSVLVSSLSVVVNVSLVDIIIIIIIAQKKSLYLPQTLPSPQPLIAGAVW